MSATPCAGVESKLQPYLDRQLTPDEVSMIEGHLGTCVYCRERYHFEAQLRDTRQDGVLWRPGARGPGRPRAAALPRSGAA